MVTACYLDKSERPNDRSTVNTVTDKANQGNGTRPEPNLLESPLIFLSSMHFLKNLPNLLTTFAYCSHIMFNKNDFYLPSQRTQHKIHPVLTLWVTSPCPCRRDTTLIGPLSLILDVNVTSTAFLYRITFKRTFMPFFQTTAKFSNAGCVF